MRRSWAGIGLAAVAFLWAAGALAGERPPRRIVSLDLCTDQLLIELVDRARIAAVTHLAADPAVSAIPDKARGLAITRGAAEDVLRYDPDLILAGPFGVAASVDLLRRQDLPNCRPITAPAGASSSCRCRKTSAGYVPQSAPSLSQLASSGKAKR